MWRYDIYQDGIKIGSTKKRTFTVKGLVPRCSYSSAVSCMRKMPISGPAFLEQSSGLCRLKHLALFLALCLLGAELCYADANRALSVPAMFSDGMVLQREEPVPV